MLFRRSFFLRRVQSRSPELPFRIDSNMEGGNIRDMKMRSYGRSHSGDGRNGMTQQKITALIAVGGILLMILLPQISLLSARKAVNLWLFTIVPSMFPFFICTDLLMKTGMHVRIGNLTENFFRKFFGVPGVAGFVYLSSILSGYPTGAKILGELYEKRQINRGDVRDILTFCSTSGPLFILGAAGAGMLQSAAAGSIILAAHCAGSLLTGMFLIRRSAFRKGLSAVTGKRRRGSKEQETESGRMRQVHPDENQNFHGLSYSGRKTKEKRYAAGGERKAATEILAESMLSSFQTLIIIGGYIVLFMILTDVMKALPQHIFGQSGFAGELLTGCLEMTSGCSGIAGAEIPFTWKITAFTFVISFGGLSVAAQSVSVLKNSGVTLPSFLRFKLIQGLISSACAVTIIKILSGFGGSAVSVFEPAEAIKAVPAFSLFSGDPGSAYSLFFSSSAAAAVMVIFYLAVVLLSGRGCSDENSGNHSGI